MLELTTFGALKIKYKDRELTFSTFNSEMLIKLFVYMVIHRTAPIESDLLCRELWGDGEVSNPTGALKNLMYRLRNFLKEYFPEDDFIISSRGAYRFNNDIECLVDSEEFDKFYADSKKSENVDIKHRLLKKAVDLYQGEFLSEIQDLRCFNVTKAYYHGMYVTVAKELCDIYFRTAKYSELNDLCNHVLTIDRLEESIYYYIIMSCVKTNDLQMGLEIYEKSSRLLKKELGVSKLESLDQAYEQLLTLDKGGARVNIADLKAQLLEDRGSGPFFCGYTIFKEIFQLIARQRASDKYTGIMLLFTIDFSMGMGGGKIEKFRADKIMKAFTETLKSTLRMGDVVSKYTEFQYIIMLNGCELENVGGIIDRINIMFCSKYPQYREANIRCQVEKIDLNSINQS